MGTPNYIYVAGKLRDARRELTRADLPIADRLCGVWRVCLIVIEGADFPDPELGARFEALKARFRCNQGEQLLELIGRLPKQETDEIEREIWALVTEVHRRNAADAVQVAAEFARLRTQALAPTEGSESTHDALAEETRDVNLLAVALAQLGPSVADRLGDDIDAVLTTILVATGGLHSAHAKPEEAEAALREMGLRARRVIGRPPPRDEDRNVIKRLRARLERVEREHVGAIAPGSGWAARAAAAFVETAVDLVPMPPGPLEPEYARRREAVEKAFDAFLDSKAWSKLERQPKERRNSLIVDGLGALGMPRKQAHNLTND